MTVWLLFALCTGLIVFSGIHVSKYGDIIAEKTGLGRAWIGFVLIAATTSLPELVTGVTSVAVHNLPDIAVGNVLGACMLNLALLAVFDSLVRKKPLTTLAYPGHVLTAAFGILLFALVGIGLLLGGDQPTIGWIGITSLLFIGIYLVSIRLVFLFEKRAVEKFVHDVAEEARADTMTTRRAYTIYALNALIIVVAASYLPLLGEQITEMTGLAQSFVGTIFIAFSTTLPEAVVSITAIRMGAIDMLFGNVLGSNLFNILVLGINDIAYPEGPLLANVSSAHMIPVLAAAAMTGAVVIGLTYRAERKPLPMNWDTLGIGFIYATAIVMMYSVGG